jgi:hypothetical protein
MADSRVRFQNFPRPREREVEYSTA